MFLELDQKDVGRPAAVDDHGATLSYGELCAFSAEFQATIGRRCLMVILSENRIGALAAYVAALAGRVVPLLLGADIHPGLFERLCALYAPEYMWCPDRFIGGIPGRPIFRRYGFTLIKRDAPGTRLHDDLSLLLTTSGSTGSPKLVRHSYGNVTESAKNVAALFALSEQDRALAILPLEFTMGLSVATSHLQAGATVLLVQSAMTDPRFWTFMKEQRATSFTGVPYSYEVLKKLRFFRMDLPDLNLITQGGGKLNDDLFRECAEYAERTGRRFIPTYGQTEGTARMAYLPAHMALTKTCSIGGAIPNGELFLVNEKGAEIPELEAAGEMGYRGPNVTMGYAHSPADLSKGDENRGTLLTGDIARRDADGCYFIVGRKNRFLKLYGVRVSLDEVEQMVRGQFHADCYCTGTDAEMRILITDSTKAQAVHDYIAAKTGLFHRSVRVITVPAIERNLRGKTLFGN